MSYSPWADDQLSEMPRTVTLAPYLGVTGNGGRSYGAAKTYHCRTEADSKEIYGPAGPVVFSTGRIIMHPKATDGTVLAAITPDAKLTLPDGTQPRILSAGGVDDEIGLVYFEIRT